MHQSQKPQNAADINMVDRVLNGGNRSCLICGHALVCSPLRGITRFMQEFQQKDQGNISFEAYEIAKICKQFVSTATIKTLTQEKEEGA